jgi:lipopolysaccharide transport system ATP-binding protein
MTLLHTPPPDARALPDDVCLRASGVSKKFCKKLKRSMLYGCLDLAGNFIGMNPAEAVLRRDEFWALDDVSFELRRGEILGLIGTNGSGKTTLLRLLAGIFPPDKGEITLRGRVAALIALGVGFHPHMTGRENIYLNGSLLGMSRDELDAKFDSILAFSEIESFIDAPVASYSSGMRVRLGFSVAIHIDPELLLIDEIFAVGDLRFRSKCQERLSDMLDRCAIVFVSHQMSTIARICSRVMILSNGKAVYDGPTPTAIREYVEKHSPGEFAPKRLGTGDATIDSLWVSGEDDGDAVACAFGAPLEVKLVLAVNPAFPTFIVVVQFMGMDGAYIVQCHSGYNGQVFTNTGARQTVQLRIPSVTLNPGRYFMTILVYDVMNTRQMAHLHAVRTVHVHGPFVGSTAIQWQGDWKITPHSAAGNQT